MKVRLKDVAQRAGVAVNTASMILNKRPNCWASKKTGERVFKAAAELRYKPSRTAVALRLGKFHTIGLLVPDLQNPHWALLAQLLQVELQKHGYDLMIESSHSSLEREISCVENILDRQVDGLIACLLHPEPHRTLLELHFGGGKPVITITPKNGTPPPVDGLILDNEPGRLEALAHLAELGHRHVAILEVSEEAATPALEGLQISHEICECTLAGAHEAASRLLSLPSRPTAILAHNDFTALGVIRAATDKGVRVPEELSVIGSDNAPIGSFMPVALTTVEFPIDKIVAEAASFILRRIKERGQGQPNHQIHSSRLVRRESTTKAPR